MQNDLLLLGLIQQRHGFKFVHLLVHLIVVDFKGLEDVVARVLIKEWLYYVLERFNLCLLLFQVLDILALVIVLNIVIEIRINVAFGIIFVRINFRSLLIRCLHVRYFKIIAVHAIWIFYGDGVVFGELPIEIKNLVLLLRRHYNCRQRPLLLILAEQSVLYEPSEGVV